MANSGKIREVGTDGVTVEAATPASQPGDIFPSGVIMHYAGASAPTNWLICDGTAVSRSTFAALFTIIGTTYGAGDGSTTFNLPDMRGKIAVGKHTSGTFTTLGQTGGEENHTLSVAELAAHSHTGATNVASPGTDSIGSHSHNVINLSNFQIVLPGTFYGSPLHPNVAFNAGVINFSSTPLAALHTGLSPNHSHAVNSHAHAISSDGGGGSHNNMPPYVVVHHIIKT